jgi:hypothetical protein
MIKAHSSTNNLRQSRTLSVDHNRDHSLRRPQQTQAIANAAGDRAEVLLYHGSVALVVGSAVAAKSDTKHPELMETPYKAKDWTCKRGEVEAVVVHFDFKGNPRGAGRKRR